MHNGEQLNDCSLPLTNMIFDPLCFLYRRRISQEPQHSAEVRIHAKFNTWSLFFRYPQERICGGGGASIAHLIDWSSAQEADFFFVLPSSYRFFLYDMIAPVRVTAHSCCPSPIGCDRTASHIARILLWSTLVFSYGRVP